ncbi:hypothetical protein KIH39_21215 [Telmatocola sphagniphila]|uniref:Uncharacterized protein n=1 Tax=Telmatocola sphagniphila TaxID=1123043 RepID=A0A8E6EUJ2_9BACT|nr:hypothetical protein [Telmatocola sphagniphila]QVL31342.1 hypothetical protein KIH39_21215 [Telmatocola sphagniphila]
MRTICRLTTFGTPYRFKLDVWGNQYGDLAFGGPSLLISEHFKEVYQQNGLTGLNGFEPALMLKCQSRLRLKETPPNYLHVELHRGFAAIDEAGSEVIWEDPIVCRYCLLGSKLKRRRRIIIDESTWSGEDIFYARGLPGIILVSSRFKEVCEQHQIKNAIFVPSEHRR